MTPAERTRQIAVEMAYLHDVSFAELIGQTRDLHIAQTREITAWVIRRVTGQTNAAIGELLRRDPSSVSVMLSRVTRRRMADPDFKEQADDLVRRMEELLR